MYPDENPAAVAEPVAPVATDPPKQDPPADPPEPETVTMPAQEAAALRRRLAEAEKAQRKTEADKKKAEEERQAEEGRYKEIAETKDRELAEERGKSARAKRDERISRLASKAQFIDPTDAIGRVTADEAEDDAGVEAALERIAKASPHLITKEAPAVPEIGVVHEPSATAKDTAQPPPGRAPLVTLEQAEALPEKERIARMDEIDALLAKQ
jgi:hypothetical protein